MKVWVLMDGDWQSDWIVAIYDNEAAALAHIRRECMLPDAIEVWDVLTQPEVEQLAKSVEAQINRDWLDPNEVEHG